MPDFTPEQLQQSLELLESILEDRTRLTVMPEELRVAFLVAAGRVSRPSRDEKRDIAKGARRIARKKAQSHDRDVRAATEIRAARRAEVFTAPPQLVPAEASPGPSGASGEEAARELVKGRGCYVCKTWFTKVHFFYDAMCTQCGDLNYRKRFQTASLEGRVAVITGARVKIGFQAALMMLRAGAHVIVTTRFPRDAASRFSRESDFGQWQSRLEVYGLDLRHSPSVEMFARYMTQTKNRLDILINNAAQTVRRPAGFYAHMLELEQRPFEDLAPELQSVLRGHESCKTAMTMGAHVDAASDGRALVGGGRAGGFVAWRGDGPGVGIRSSALLSQVPCAYDDATNDAEIFPVGKVDADLQQVDLRSNNSWRLKLADVPSPEMLEVQLVNAVAPFILCSKLKPLMQRDRTGEKHIVNVSAVEGQFSRRKKTDKHPHTNMAKAALNMMTLTSAPDYAAEGIFMNAVDTGWVTDEDPAALSARKQELHDFQPPLDIVDGAARICDPFFSGLLTGEHVWGKFLKDYAPCAW
ncbi:MAG: oxidoreductase [Myxococcales bacterium 68-20]|nr:MAG: oxidoreductase [Myxococcales bacterium 68-20]